jgi:hypothetical protein
MTRTKRSTLTFTRAFALEGGERSFPAGAYEVVTDEEVIEGLSFPAYRRVASWILTPAQTSSKPIEMITIDPIELVAAHAHDSGCNHRPSENSESECTIKAG